MVRSIEDKEHIERRVTCSKCPNKYCIDCNTNGCNLCGSTEFYTTHRRGIIYNIKDLADIHDYDREAVSPTPNFTFDANPDRLYSTTGSELIGISPGLITTGSTLSLSSQTEDPQLAESHRRRRNQISALNEAAAQHPVSRLDTDRARLANITDTALRNTYNGAF